MAPLLLIFVIQACLETLSDAGVMHSSRADLVASAEPIGTYLKLFELQDQSSPPPQAQQPPRRWRHVRPCTCLRRGDQFY
jgi:hypothetical protein